ncbi:MAG: NUDIX hydrolase [Actinobacteria bacterium]|nr:NUDIX hydrolase [Actinomycetota bacterium]
MTDAEVQRAAGGALWRCSHPDGDPPDEGIEVALVHRPRYDDWTLPKGKLNPGESDLAAALREIEEETGYTGSPGRYLGEVSYLKPTDGEARPKVVCYWEFRATGGSFFPTEEVDDLRWLPVDGAKGLLSREADQGILEAFEEQPVTTSVVLMVRHASAGNRAEWERDDRLRPLDAKGRRQAEGLVSLLRPWAISEIVSADFVRCVETVQPLGESIGVSITQDPLFSELGYPGSEERAIELVRTMANREWVTCLCSQGDVIPDLLGRLARQDDLAPHPRKGGRGSFKAKKGAVWALCWSRGRLVGAESLGPPHQGLEASLELPGTLG